MATVLWEGERGRGGSSLGHAKPPCQAPGTTWVSQKDVNGFLSSRELPVRDYKGNEYRVEKNMPFSNGKEWTKTKSILSLEAGPTLVET